MSKAEKAISRCLHVVLKFLPCGADVDSSVEFKEILSGLEYFIPQLLRELHPEWEHESLDGILPLVARKTKRHEIEIIGACLLISDQTTTPIHIRLQATPERNEVSWMECRLGRMRDNAMERTRYAKFGAKQLVDIADTLDSIEWAYAITFGQRDA